MFNYCNLLTYVFMDCILFKWKLCLFLDFFFFLEKDFYTFFYTIYVCMYVCILSGMEDQNDKVI